MLRERERRLVPGGPAMQLLVPQKAKVSIIFRLQAHPSYLQDC